MSTAKHEATVGNLMVLIKDGFYRGRRTTLISKVCTADARAKTVNEIMGEFGNDSRFEKLFDDGTSFATKRLAVSEALEKIAEHPDLARDVEACRASQMQKARTVSKVTATGLKPVGAR